MTHMPEGLWLKFNHVPHISFHNHTCDVCSPALITHTCIHCIRKAAEETPLTSPSSWIIHEALQRKQFRRSADTRRSSQPSGSHRRPDKNTDASIFILSHHEKGGGPFTLRQVMWCRACEQFRGDAFVWLNNMF